MSNKSRSEGLVMFVLALAATSTAVYQTVLTPFVPFFVVDSGKAVDMTTPGRYAGWLTSSGHFGRILTSYAWGRYSDKGAGRVKVLEMSLMSIFFSSLVLSWTLNFYVAIAARFLCGSLDASWSMVKAYASSALPKEAQASTMATLGASYGMAMIIGPALGGLLARPAQEYPGLGIAPSSLLSKKPYFLPNLATALIALAAAILVRLVLEPQGGQSHTEKRAAIESTLKPSHYQTMTNIKHKEKEDEENSICCARKPGLATAFYSIFSAIEYAEDLCFPLWAEAPRSVGGLGIGNSQVGILLALCGIFIVPGQLFLYAPLDTRIGSLNILKYGVQICTPLSALMPLASTLFDSDIKSKRMLWVWLGLTKIFRLFIAEFVFTAQGIVSNNAVPDHIRGSYLGIQAAICAMARIVGPILVGPLFAWSIQVPRPFPLNYWLSFLLITFGMVISLITVLLMPESLDRPFVSEITDDHEEGIRRRRSNSWEQIHPLKRSRSPHPLLPTDDSSENYQSNHNSAQQSDFKSDDSAAAVIRPPSDSSSSSLLV